MHEYPREFMLTFQAELQSVTTERFLHVFQEHLVKVHKVENTVCGETKPGQARFSWGNHCSAETSRVGISWPFRARGRALEAGGTAHSKSQRLLCAVVI